jgi:hypothetical protein
MFGLFTRRKNEQFLTTMMKAAAEGERIAQLRRALNTLSIKQKEGESATEYSARAADHMTRTIMQRAGASTANDDDLYVGGLFIFIIANHFTYVLEGEFEQAASLGLLMFLTTSGMDMNSAASSNGVIADAYNAMTVKKDKYLEAVGGQLVGWTQTPSEERMGKLTQLFNIARQNVHQP